MRTLGIFVLFVSVGAVAPLQAQSPILPVSSMASAAAGAEADATAVRLLVGRSAVVDVQAPIARVSLTSPDIADAMVTGQSQLLVNGKLPGTITMFVWDRAGGIRKYDVVVQRDLARLNDQIRQLFPGETIDAQSNGRSVVLSGMVSSKEVIARAVDVAAGYVEKKEDVVPLLQIREGGASNQVLLRVRFAEVSRSALMELGSSLFTSISGYKDYVARSTTQQFSAPDFDWKNGGLVFSDYLNLFLFNTKQGLGTVIKALSNKGLFQSLAEPNLVAESGKEASFLAGGEIPIPIAQGSGGTVSISVQYKEFGVRLNFLPVVTGNRVHLRVRPEVSTLDFNNAVVLNGFRIPALSTRRTETELELENGQTFAIAGLMNNSVNSSMRKIPGIGDIPILGLLFQSKAAEKNQTELVVMITPEILPNNSTGVTGRLPYTPERFLEPVPNDRLYEQPAPAFQPNGASRSSDSGAPRPSSNRSTQVAPVAKPAPVAAAPPAASPAGIAASAARNPQAAAAAVAALAPKTRDVINGDAPAAAPPASAPAPPASSTAPPAAPSGTPPAAAARKPLTSAEKKALERAHEQEERAKADAARAAVKQAAADRERQKKEAEVQARQARERAKADAEAAKKAAKSAAKAAKREAELEKKRQEAEARRQNAISEAQRKLDAAQALYQAEVSRQQQ
ncbi:MAG: type II and III secretion system protein family protein [Acidobacteria bacterium]|nr:type II and III secretion system protein family protein [Acidobacteriota bacterium]